LNESRFAMPARDALSVLRVRVCNPPAARGLRLLVAWPVAMKAFHAITTTLIVAGCAGGTHEGEDSGIHQGEEICTRAVKCERVDCQ